MKLTLDSFCTRFQDLVSSPTPEVMVGFSGGLDSTVLLHLCHQLRQKGTIACLRAVHLHHGLSSLADSWVEHVEAICRDWDIPLNIGYVKVSAGSNVEESARDARYSFFETQLGGDEFLLQAHHRDDQVETQLYRLMRGTGISGLQGIPAVRSLGRGTLARPLLSFERADMEQYAKKFGLAWIEDDSNIDTRYDRNFLRHEIVPQLNRRWPGMKASLARLTEICSETEELLADIALADLESCSLARHFPIIGEQLVLDIAALQGLTLSRQQLLLRAWLTRLGLAVPGKAMLQRVLGEVASARKDADPALVWGGGLVRRHRGFLLAFQKPFSEKTFQPQVFTGQQSLPLSNGDVVWILPTEGDNKGLFQIKSGVYFTCTPRADIQVQPFALSGRKGRKSLKKWLNELDVPSWVRGRLPVLHQGDSMVAIPGLFIAEGFQADLDNRGLGLKWICHK